MFCVDRKMKAIAFILSDPSIEFVVFMDKSMLEWDNFVATYFPDGYNDRFYRAVGDLPVHHMNDDGTINWYSPVPSDFPDYHFEHSSSFG